MDSVTLKNYRCFREEQTARLAPLTLLVGENSTGKTSFLAILRALWDVAFVGRVPDFREDPFDLGAFEDIVHARGSVDKKSPKSFDAGFIRSQSHPDSNLASFCATFEEIDGAPVPVNRKFGNKEFGVEVGIEEGEQILILTTPQNQHRWKRSIEGSVNDNLIPPPIVPGVMWHVLLRQFHDDQSIDEISESPPTEDELEKIDALNQALFSEVVSTPRPLAVAPVRSRPRRTYDPIRLSQDPEGEYIPAYLANLYRGNSDEWQKLKASLEGFGRKSGLFDDISVMSFGKTSGAPFQIRIRKWGKRRKGVERNLIDVGYGVSQALPIVTELLRPDALQMFLLQQPEVHLHPSAQAALGTLFCDVASQGKQLIVETHSDYIIDRVRMDVRDKTTALKPDDVSILYFERDDLDVKIHSIRLDEMGNVLDAPHSYGKFFMEETRRSLGL